LAFADRLVTATVGGVAAPDHGSQQGEMDMVTGDDSRRARPRQSVTLGAAFSVAATTGKRCGNGLA
jgi:hypothetical protein